MPVGEDLMAQPPAVVLPADAEADAQLSGGTPPEEVAAAHPAYPAAWAALAEQALAAGEVIAAYAYARTGYHRGLDALRKNGWKGFGPVPWSHEGNRGVLRCFYYLAQAAQQIGETDEYERLTTLLDDSDPAARQALG